jgi:hypothetical protein
MHLDSKTPGDQGVADFVQKDASKQDRQQGERPGHLAPALRAELKKNVRQDEHQREMKADISLTNSSYAEGGSHVKVIIYQLKKKAGTRPAHREIPQTLPGLQAGALETTPPELPPATRAAKVEIFFLTCRLPQPGQTTSDTALALRTNSSKGLPHSWQINSNIGMFYTSIHVTGNLKIRCRSL